MGCIWKFFAPEFYNEEDNLLFCSKCNQKNKGAKKFFLKNPPQILIILLKRYKADKFSKIEKSSKQVDTLETICMDDFAIINGKNKTIILLDVTLKQLNEIDKGIEDSIKKLKVSDASLHLFEYQLYGVSSHSGTLRGGHYVAYIKNEGDWYYASDSFVKKVPKEDALNAEAYVLYYEKIEKSHITPKQL